jgi:hypothetical protein
MFEMEFKKMVHFIFLVIFHLKVTFGQNFDLPHIYSRRPKTTQLWYDNCQTLRMDHKLILIIQHHNTFYKGYKLFQPFLKYIFIFSYVVMFFF